MNNHFNKEIEILKRNQAEILRMKESINHIINSMENVTNILDHLEDRTSDNEDKIFNIGNKEDPGPPAHPKLQDSAPV